MTEQDVKAIMDANDNPPEPNDALKQAAEKQKQREAIVEMMRADEEDGLYDDWDSTLNDGLEDDIISEEDRLWIQELEKKEQETTKELKNKKTNRPKIIS
jgi:hypothetical protein